MSTENNEIKENITTSSTTSSTTTTSKVNNDGSTTSTVTSQQDTVTKQPININIDEKTQSKIIKVVNTIYEKFFSENKNYKILFFGLLIFLVLAAAFLSYYDYITIDSFKAIFNTFLNIFSDPSISNTAETVSQFNGSNINNILSIV